MRLKDKVAIVTGGGVGIGKAYAHGLAKEGAKVVVADIQEAEAQKVAGDIKAAGGEAIAVAVDVTSPEKTQAMAAAALKAYGRIDILVNNAGLYSALKKKEFMEIDTDEWDRVMAVNVKGLFLCVKAVYPAMKQQKKGKIINISSGTTQSGTPFFLHYVSSKAGVIGFHPRARARSRRRQYLRQFDHARLNHFQPKPGRRHEPPSNWPTAESAAPSIAINIPRTWWARSSSSLPMTATS